ncbi:cyclase family protein [Gramella sp. BOM4]|nr:cyclase family protein [Christiangramia bathymodioli]
MKKLVVYFFLFISAIGFGQQPKGEIVDLTHAFSQESLYWVTAKPFKLEEVARGETEKGYYYSANNFETAEHGGTHIDAPIHFAAGAQSVDEVPLENLIGDAVKIDISEKALKDPDYLISIDDLKNWEAVNGEIASGSIVLLQTGFGRYYPDAKKYLGTENRGEAAVKELHFPGFSAEAAEWLIQNRKIKAVGIDTASIDFGQSTEFSAHVALMTKNVPAFENVANLDQLPARGFTVIALPMKIKGGSGGPLRIIAIK